MSIGSPASGVRGTRGVAFGCNGYDYACVAVSCPFQKTKCRKRVPDSSCHGIIDKLKTDTIITPKLCLLSHTVFKVERASKPSSPSLTYLLDRVQTTHYAGYCGQLLLPLKCAFYSSALLLSHLLPQKSL